MFDGEKVECTVHVPSICAPSKAIYRRKVHDIVDFDDKLIIDGFKLKMKGGRIQSLILESECLHPNCNPFNREFCLPHTIVGGKMGKQMLFRIIQVLKTYYLDDCYEFPRELFTMRQHSAEMT